MKIFFLLTLITFSQAQAQGEAALRKKIDSVLTDLSTLQNGRKDANLDEIMKTQSFQESQLLNSVMLAYNYLKEYNLTERYVFLSTGMETYAQAKAQDNFKIFNNWLTEANQRIVFLGLPESFYGRWNVYVESVKSQINPLLVTRKNMMIQSNDLLMKRVFNNLNDSKKILYGLEDSVSVKASGIEKKVSVNQMVSSPLPLVGGMIFFVMSLVVFYFSRKKPTYLVRAMELAQKQAEAQAAAASTEFMTTPAQVTKPVAETVIDLDKNFRQVFHDNKFLFETASIKLHHPASSPFKTEITGSREVVNEGINSLLKGTLAIANNSAKKPTHMDWVCKEKSGRIGIEMTLYGMECDQQNLYMQSLLDGYGSAPAHFGRAERILSNNGANVTVTSANNKTTVYLGLDMVNHPFYQN
jgi:hypothetical protein